MRRRIYRLPRSIVAAMFFATGMSVAAADPEVSQLDFFVGRWNCDGHFVAKNTEIKSVVTFSWDEETKSLSVRHEDLAPNRYNAFELWGVSKAAKEYRGSVADAYSGIRWYTSPGFVGETLTWTRNEGGVPAERFSYTRKSPTQFNLEWRIARNGKKLTLGDTVECRRMR